MDNNRTLLTNELQRVMDWKLQSVDRIHDEHRISDSYLFKTINPDITTEKDHYFENQRRKIMNLVYLGADPEITNGWGETCLAKALLYDDFETAELLLKHGANPNAKQATILPLPLIYYVKKLNVAQLLVTYGLRIADQAGLLHHCMGHYMLIEDISPELISFYIQHGALACEQDAQGDTALHILIRAMRKCYQGNWDEKTISSQEHIWLSKARCLLDAAPQLLTIENKKRETPDYYIMFGGGLYPQKITALLQKMHALFKMYRGDRAS